MRRFPTPDFFLIYLSHRLRRLCLPVPLLWTLNVPLRKSVLTLFHASDHWLPTFPSRKLIISVFLSSGVLVISASIIRTSITLTGTPSSFIVNSWGVRETFVGIVAVNLPIFAPIVHRGFWTQGSYRPSVRLTRSGTAWDTLQDSSREQGADGQEQTIEIIDTVCWHQDVLIQSCGHVNVTGCINKDAKIQEVVLGALQLEIV